MRFTPRFQDLTHDLRLERRAVERPDGVASTIVPSGWTDARIEAWLDWAASLPADLPRLSDGAAAPSPVLDGAVDRWAGRLAAWGRAMGVFAGEKDARAFADDLTASVLLGLAAPGSALPDGARVHPIADDPAQGALPPPVANLDDPLARSAFDRETDAVQGLRLAERSVGRVCATLNAVADAVARCEGPAADCADPSANPALARSAWAARQAGADDGAILRAVAGERFVTPDAAPAHQVRLAVLSADANDGAIAAAARAALAGELVLAFDTDTATALALTEDAASAALAAATTPAVAQSPRLAERAAVLHTVKVCGTDVASRTA